MKLEGITVCVGYADFLAETLPLNKVHFDKYVVVTSADDTATQKLCEYHYVQWVSADFGPPGEFHKAEGINRGLQELDMDGWVVHLDADIVLLPQTKPIIQSLELDKFGLYGIDRFLVRSYKDWRRICRRPQQINEMNTYIHTERYPIATRFMASPHGGYLPIGFFQMWCPKASGVYEYPANHTNAGRTDMLFASTWPRCERHLLAELVCFHLESEAAPQGTNWGGRKTKPFRRLTFWEWCFKWRCKPPTHLPPPVTYEV